MFRTNLKTNTNKNYRIGFPVINHLTFLFCFGSKNLSKSDDDSVYPARMIMRIMTFFCTINIQVFIWKKFNGPCAGSIFRGL